MINAPIVLFVYNRPWHTEQTLEALMQNELADESELIIYADGAKEGFSKEEQININEVRSIIRKKRWCKSVDIVESATNKGLSDSIIDGVSTIINQFGKVIVLEDDIVTAKGFLRYMNDALTFYEHEEKVMHISGFMYPHNEPLPQTLFYNVPLCWGWGTWKRAWQHLEADANILVKYFDRANDWKRFNKFGGIGLENQLRENVDETIKTWFIKWHASVLIKNGYCLFPGNSLVNNIGFDGSGVHNGAINNFAHDKLSKGIEVEKIKIQESKLAEKIIKLFYQNLIADNSRIDSAKTKRTSYPFPFKQPIKKIAGKLIRWAYPELNIFKNELINFGSFTSKKELLILGVNATLYQPFEVYDTLIDDYTYVSTNAFISKTIIGKFCSIGPNFMCGRGIHPLNGLSTSPSFYSIESPNGKSFSLSNKVVDRKNIVIGSDVFIGANVTVLDGVTIGDGAVIGAGAVVSKDIPPYAIAVGSPIHVIKYRFTESQIEQLLKIKWWNFQADLLPNVELDFFDIDSFIKKYSEE